MPRFFVDFQDGQVSQADDIGSDAEGLEEVRDAAIAMLPQVARDRLSGSGHREFSVTVRDERGTALYRATLTFHGEHLVDPAAEDDAKGR